MDNTNERNITRTRKSLPGIQWRQALKLAISLGLLAVILFLVDLRVLFNTLINGNPWYIVGGVALVYLDRMLMAYKWNPLLRVVGIKVSLWTLFRIYVVTPIVQLILPSTVGMDLFRVYGLKRRKDEIGLVVASIIMERLIGLIAILALVVISIGLGFYLLQDALTFIDDVRWALAGGILLLATITVGVLVLLRKGLYRMAKRIAGNSVADMISRAASTFMNYKNFPRVLMIVGLWTFVEQFFTIALTLLAVYALDVDVSWLALVVIVPITVLAGRLPISLDGIGIQEGLYVALFSLVGVSAAEAVLISVLGRVIILISALPWGIHYIFGGRALTAPTRS